MSDDRQQVRVRHKRSLEGLEKRWIMLHICTAAGRSLKEIEQSTLGHMTSVILLSSFCVVNA